MQESVSGSYAAAGVDVTAGYETVDRIKPLVESTFIKGVLGSLGGFGGMFDISEAGIENPVLVSGADGVGTKLKIAFNMQKHDTVGIDCVAMCVNDIICAGATPLFFLDYVAMGKNYPERSERIVAGIAQGCRDAGCALIGGETAEMPGFYPDEEYDLAGFAVGAVSKGKIIDGSGIVPGDAIIGLPSSGLHSNGFSLVRRVFDMSAESLATFTPELGKTLGEELLTPTQIYVKTVLNLIECFGSDIKGLANITGGGFYENAPRCLPDGIRGKIDATTFPRPAIFDLIAENADIPMRDMYNTFNMGIGLIIVVPNSKKDAIVSHLRDSGEAAYIIGETVSGEKGVDVVW